jgi:hypothetical protein
MAKQKTPTIRQLKITAWLPIAANVREIVARRGISLRTLALELDEKPQTVWQSIARDRPPGSGGKGAAGSEERRMKKIHAWLKKHAVKTSI